MKHLSSNLFFLTFLSEGTVFDGQFNWGGFLQKGNGGAQRSAWSGWKSDCKGKRISRLNSEGDHPN